ncbi:DNA-binding protein [Candidatus Enterococcus mangumiae]|uniref:DNA-binding protein n=1 Tax=Candidatus Enterococcus mangumiae TaxID=2230878 RepID=A0ABZ2T007_9ENTE|nr:DNA-binding protein [Enterococcus sp. DIV1094]MBO0489729.1 DNA-binding protein [Enterococcus sp. DIV1094]
MIEHYLEKNLLRQLFLCGQFYINKEVHLPTTATLLHVCQTTLLNDIKSLSRELSDQIIYHSKEKETYSLYFEPTTPRFQLMQRISRPSLFLKTCLLYLEDEPDYIQLTELEFVSVSKAYALKKQVLDYFQACDISIEYHSPRFTDIERRLILLNVSYRTGTLPEFSVPASFDVQAQEFIQAVTKKSGRIYDRDTQEILQTGFLISLFYQKNSPLSVDQSFIDEIKKRPIYDFVLVAWEESPFREFFQPNEFYFILILFNLCDYGFATYEAIEQDFAQLHQVFIENNPETKQLIQQFEEHFGHSFLGNKAFERALIRILRSAWKNYQLFLPEKFHLLTDEQRQLFEEVKQIVSDWTNTLPYQLKINPNCLRSFVIELTGILRLDKQKLSVRIVTHSDIKYLIYREALEGVTTCDISVEPMIYNRLNEEAIDFATAPSHRLLCERTLYTPVALSMDHVIPISVETVEQAIILLIKNRS